MVGGRLLGEYLDDLGIANVLYQDFNRLGCYHGHQAVHGILHSLWDKYPDLYALAKEWDNEARRLTNGTRGLRRGLLARGWRTSSMTGSSPRRRRPTSASSCVAVGAVEKGHIDMEDFDTDNAPEHDPAMAAMIAKAEGLIQSDDDWEAPACEIGVPDEPEDATASSVAVTSTRTTFEHTQSEASPITHPNHDGLGS